MQKEKSQNRKHKLICVTNRHLCEDDFLDRLRRIAYAGRSLNNPGTNSFCNYNNNYSSNDASNDNTIDSNIDSNIAGKAFFGGIILREKDLSISEYEKLALAVKEICDEAGVDFIAHNFPEIDFADHLHLPLHKLKELDLEGSIDASQNELLDARSKPNSDSSRNSHIVRLGASCHSVEDAKTAESLGCSYVTFGHVFETDCKKGLEPRGLSLLGDVVRSVSIPVYAIGGISPGNYLDVIGAGAEGACIMSGFMKCPDPEEYIRTVFLPTT